MTLSVTSGQHLWKFEKKTAQNAAFDGFGSNFSLAAFCLTHQSVGFLFVLPFRRLFEVHYLVNVSVKLETPDRHVVTELEYIIG